MRRQHPLSRLLAAGGLCGVLAGCTVPSQNLDLVEGPAVMDVVTPFDGALACLDGKVDKRLGFAVGNIPDGTGREAYNGEGAGKFVTQSAGDIVQSALFKTGVKVINRRDVGSTALEANWGLRNLQTQMPAHFAITGSVNSLDFIPGGGAFVNVAGVGARYRQNRILVGLDLAMTNLATGQIVANIALRKQVVADEAGLFGSGFTDGNLVDADLGGMRREALNDALRTMLQLATYELLIQLMPPQKHAECSAQVDPRYGQISGAKTAGEQLEEFKEAQAAAAASAASAPIIEDAYAGETGTGNGTPQEVAASTDEAAEAALAQAEAAVEIDNARDDIRPNEGGANFESAPAENDNRLFRFKRNPTIPPGGSPGSSPSS
jgi:curli biogenesis system outer membrane secretion channel CsgG